MSGRWSGTDNLVTTWSAPQITATFIVFARRKKSCAMTAQAAKFHTASHARLSTMRVRLAVNIKLESAQKKSKKGLREALIDAIKHSNSGSMPQKQRNAENACSGSKRIKAAITWHADAAMSSATNAEQIIELVNITRLRRTLTSVLVTGDTMMTTIDVNSFSPSLTA